MWQIINKLILLMTMVWVSSFWAWADKFNTETISSTRALGMGNAVINTERGANSVFYNPANIAAKNTNFHFQVVNLQFDGNEGLGQYVTGKGGIGISQLGTLYPYLKDNPNTFVSSRVSVFPNITFRNFSLGFVYELNQGAEYNSYVDSVRIKARNRAGPVAALSYRLLSGILRLGASAQYLTVGNADATISHPSNDSLNYGKNISSGTGLVTTGGATLTFPFKYLPSFSAVARNIGGTRYTKAGLISFGSAGAPENQPMTIDLASALIVYFGKHIDIKFEADYRDFTNRLQANRMRHIFLGSELTLFNTLQFRTGLQHGYLSFGFGIDTRKAKIQFAVYKDEKDDRYRANPDVRGSFQITFSMFK